MQKIFEKGLKIKKIELDLHSLGNYAYSRNTCVKIDAEHAGAIIFTPKSSKTYEFLHFSQ